MAEKRGMPFWVVRLRNFMLQLLKNKMAITGLIILLVFSFIAVAAPLLTPYDPQGTIVSGHLDPPSWISLLQGEVGFSRNTEFTGLTTTASGSGVSVVPTVQGPDAVTIAVDSTGSSGGTVRVEKTLAYEFRGPPKRFIGSAKITPSGISISNSATLTATVETVGEAPWNFWQTTLNSSAQYLPPYGGGRFDSNDLTLRKRLQLETTSLSPAEVIFDKVAIYKYSLTIALPPAPLQASFTITGFDMGLLGNTWGLLGTDDAGRDLFSQLVYGARISLLVGFLATGVGVGVGLLVGLLAGYLGKAVDEVLMRFTDMMLVIPGLPLLIVLVAVLGSSLFNIILVLGFLGWMGFARVVRSQVLSLRERPFIEAAKASGAGTGYITLRHIFPNIVSLTYVNLALSVPAAIVGEAALSFLGLGDSTVISWGRMLEESRSVGGTASSLVWWWVIPPGLSIAILSLSFILLGYALDEMFNPKLRKRR